VSEQIQVCVIIKGAQTAGLYDASESAGTKGGQLDMVIKADYKSAGHAF
jgi:hypothetical protein